jgi:hypothetical protein
MCPHYVTSKLFDRVDVTTRFDADRGDLQSCLRDEPSLALDALFRVSCFSVVHALDLFAPLIYFH